MKTSHKINRTFSKTTTGALFLLGAISLIASGCSSFNRDWKRAVTSPQTKTGVEGRWEGTWTSDANGHSGALRCLFEKISEESYRARFDSTYKKVLHFKSTVILKGTNDASGFSFRGDAKLPWWAGGVYHYEGKASATNFFSTYGCKYDHGTFQMTRPDPK